MGGTKHMLSLTISERTILHRKIFLLADGTKNANESQKKTGNYADQVESLIRSCCGTVRLRYAVKMQSKKIMHQQLVVPAE